MDNIAQISVIPLIDVKNDSRIDAEFYKRSLLELEETIEKQRFEPLKSLVKKNTRLKQPVYIESSDIKIINSQYIGDFLDIELAKMGLNIIVKPESVLVNSTGRGTLGRVAINYLKEKVSVDSHVDVMEVIDGMINPYYLMVFLKTKFGQCQIERRERGSSGQTEIYPKDFEKLKIPLPNVAFQKEIEFLCKDAFEKYQKSKKLYQQAQQLLLEKLSVTDLDLTNELTYTANFSNVLQNNRIDAECYKPKYERLFKNIDTVAKNNLWELRKIGEISEPLRYGTSENLTYLTEGVPFLRITDIQGFSFEKSSLVYISEKDARKVAYAKVIEGDLIISRSGTLGLTVPMDNELSNSIYGSYFIRIRPKIKVDRNYLALYLNSIIGKLQVEQRSTGAIQTNLTIPVIENIQVLLPDPEFQGKISNLLKESKTLRETAHSLLEEAKKKVEQKIAG